MKYSFPFLRGVLMNFAQLMKSPVPIEIDPNDENKWNGVYSPNLQKIIVTLDYRGAENDTQFLKSIAITTHEVFHAKFDKVLTENEIRQLRHPLQLELFQVFEDRKDEELGVQQYRGMRIILPFIALQHFRDKGISGYLRLWARTGYATGKLGELIRMRVQKSRFAKVLPPDRLERAYAKYLDAFRLRDADAMIRAIKEVIPDPPDPPKNQDESQGKNPVPPDPNESRNGSDEEESQNDPERQGDSENPEQHPKEDRSKSPHSSGESSEQDSSQDSSEQDSSQDSSKDNDINDTDEDESESSQSGSSQKESQQQDENNRPMNEEQKQINPDDLLNIEDQTEEQEPDIEEEASLIIQGLIRGNTAIARAMRICARPKPWDVEKIPFNDRFSSGVLTPPERAKIVSPTGKLYRVYRIAANLPPTYRTRIVEREGRGRILILLDVSSSMNAEMDCPYIRNIHRSLRQRESRITNASLLTHWIAKAGILSGSPVGVLGWNDVGLYEIVRPYQDSIPPNVLLIPVVLGGTSMGVAYNYLRFLSPPPDIIITITDGEIDEEGLYQFTKIAPYSYLISIVEDEKYFRKYFKRVWILNKTIPLHKFAQSIIRELNREVM